jgi:hypothetical protein
MKAHVQTKTCTCTFRVKRRKQMSFNQWMNKQSVVCQYSGIVFYHMNKP